MSEFNLSSTKLNETQNHDDFQVFWCSLKDIPNELQHFVDYLTKFDTWQECAIHIAEKVRSDRKILLVLITSDSFGFVSYFNDFPQIHAIYVLDENFEKLNEQNKPKKLNGIFINECALIDRLRRDILLTYRNDLSIKEFANEFTTDTALHWYTKDSFFYRLLNKAFRTRNIDLICKFQYSIILLYQQLKLLSKEQQEENHLTVFRGQSLSKNDLEMLKANVGRLISMNTMMSTTHDRHLASSFILGAEIGVIFEIDTKNANAEALKPFANISKFSLYSQEEEVLFFAGTVFLIDSVNQEPDSTWSIKLIFQVETDEQLRQLADGFEKQLVYATQTHHLFMKTDDFTMAKRYYKMLTNEDFPLNQIPINMIQEIVGYLWSNLGNYEKAIQLYKDLLSQIEPSNDTPKMIVIHISIGYNYFNLSQHDNALLHYGIALSLLDEKSLVVGEVYNHLGDVWSKAGDLEQAILYYKDSIIILNTNLDARLYTELVRKISSLYRELGNDSDAILYEALLEKIKQKYGSILEQDTELRLKHSQHELCIRTDLKSLERAHLLYEIGLCHMKKGEYSQALENLLQAKQLFIDDPPPCHHFVRQFSTLYENIALIYLITKKYLKALVMWKKAIDIRMTIPWN